MESNKDINKEFYFYLSLNIIIKAWNDITTNTIINCWAKTQLISKENMYDSLNKILNKDKFQEKILIENDELTKLENMRDEICEELGIDKFNFEKLNKEKEKLTKELKNKWMILDLQESENSNFESNENQIYHNNMLENNSILKIINELNEIYENSIININLRKEDRKKRN